MPKRFGLCTCGRQTLWGTLGKARRWAAVSGKVTLLEVLSTLSICQPDMAHVT